MTRCDWASCRLLATSPAGGWWFCDDHLVLHRRLLAEERGQRKGGRPKRGEVRVVVDAHAAFMAELERFR